MNDPITLPDAVPVMPLPGALLFPHAMLPLYIFEARYRAMLEHALANHRMFCVTLINPDYAGWDSVDDFNHIATVGLIRACVGRGDATSNLILQGLQRVEFTSFRQEKPFPIADIQPLGSVRSAAAETDALAAKVLEIYAAFKRKGRRFPEKVDEYLSRLTDTEMLADLMAATFVVEPIRRQRLLEELSVARRLRLLIRYLRDESGDPVV
jgi:ATP-dependent Lon protease